jgi:KDO2-lipid IV(A) lauroyltransferase
MPAQQPERLEGVATAQPHAPKVSWLRKVLGPFYVTGVFWYWFPTVAPRVLPGWAFVPTETFCGAAFFLFLHNVRRAIRYNLTAVLGPCGYWAGQWRALRTLVTFSQCFGDRYERLVRGKRFRVVVEGKDVWEEASRSGRGIILVTAHVGAWDAMSQLAPAGLARVVHVVREEEIDPASQEFIRRLVREQGDPNCHTHFATGDPSLGLQLKQALERGDLVALQGDRPRVGSRSVVASLFGRTMDLPAGPAVLARLTGAELLPVFCFRERHYLYRIVFRPPIRVRSDVERGQAEVEATQGLGREIEWAIRHRPHQWFALGRVWHAAARGENGYGRRPSVR